MARIAASGSNSPPANAGTQPIDPQARQKTGEPAQTDRLAILESKLKHLSLPWEDPAKRQMLLQEIQAAEQKLKQDAQRMHPDGEQSNTPSLRPQFGGPAPLKQAPAAEGQAPAPRNLTMVALDKAENFLPRTVNAIRNTLRFTGPILAAGTFGLNVEQLVANWHKLKPANKVALTGATAASGVSAVAAGATLFNVARAMPLAIGAGGAAATIFSAMHAWNEFNDPTKTAGQRGMAVITTGLAAASTACLLIPGLQPIGIGLGIVGGITSLFGDKIGKIPFVNNTFKAIGQAASWVGHAASNVGHALGHAASAVGHFLSHPFGL